MSERKPLKRCFEIPEGLRDEEVLAIYLVLTILKDFDKKTKERILIYLNSKFEDKNV